MESHTTAHSLWDAVQKWAWQLSTEHRMFVVKRCQDLLQVVCEHGVEDEIQQAEQDLTELLKALYGAQPNLSTWTLTGVADLAAAAYTMKSATEVTVAAVMAFITTVGQNPQLVKRQDFDTVLPACASVAASGHLTGEQAMQLLRSLLVHPHLKTCASASVLVDAFMVVAEQRAAEDKQRQRPTFISKDVKAQLLLLDRRLQRLCKYINGRTLSRLLQAGAKLGVGFVRLFKLSLRGRGAWAAEAVKGMRFKDLVWAAGACASLNMRNLPLTNAILKRCSDLQSSSGFSQLPASYHVQLARAVAVLRATDYQLMCIKAVECCSSRWQQLAAHHHSMLGWATAWLRKTAVPDNTARTDNMLSPEQQETVKQQLEQQIREAKPSGLQTGVYRGINRLPGDTFSSEPRQEVPSADGVTSFDIFTISRQGTLIVWQVEGPSHMVLWVDAGEVTGQQSDDEDNEVEEGQLLEPPKFTLEFNGPTCLRNWLQSAEQCVVVAVCCMRADDLVAPGSEADLQAYLLRRVATADRRQLETTRCQQQIARCQEEDTVRNQQEIRRCQEDIVRQQEAVLDDEDKAAAAAAAAAE